MILQEKLVLFIIILVIFTLKIKDIRKQLSIIPLQWIKVNKSLRDYKIKECFKGNNNYKNAQQYKINLFINILKAILSL